MEQGFTVLTVNHLSPAGFWLFLLMFALQQKTETWKKN